MLYITLNNGVKMPAIGYGVFQIPSHDDCVKAVSNALDVGYRLIDTAQAYDNEEAVGQAIKQSSIPRSEVFLTTKIWITHAGEQKATESINDSLRKLKTDYVDLLMIHQPYNDYYGTYRAMERALKEGKCRALGVSNFFADRLVDLCCFVETKPQVNQVETHVFQQQSYLKTYLDRYRILLEAWGPLAEGANNLFEHPLLKKLATKYNKTVAQIALRFLVQQGIVAIPKTVHVERMSENLDIFDFEILRSDMELIKALDTKESLFADHYDPEFIQDLANFR